MNIVSTISLITENDKIEDIQLWGNIGNDSKGGFNGLKSDNMFRVVSYINYEQIPIYLLSSKPFHVYSNEDKTSKFFQENLAEVAVKNDQTGLMLKNEQDENMYLVLYIDVSSGSLQVKCMFIDFKILEKMNRVIENDDDDECINYFIDSENTTTIAKSTDTSIFDKVLSDKRRKLKSNQFIMPNVANPKHVSTQLSSLVLNTQEQITQAVNKVILSGLRIRGLNLNNSSQNTNEKIAIKEIYQMTFKSTMFSLRKFNYGFNQEHTKSEKKGNVKLNDIQDLVEKLLQVFVDIDDISSLSTPKSFST